MIFRPFVKKFVHLLAEKFLDVKLVNGITIHCVIIVLFVVLQLIEKMSAKGICKKTCEHCTKGGVAVGINSPKDNCCCVLCAAIEKLEQIELNKKHKNMSIRENQIDARSKWKVKILMDNDEQTTHFIPKITENVDDCVNFSDVSNVKRGRTQYILIDVINPTKNSILLTKGTIIDSVHSVSAVIPLKIEDFEVGENGKLGNGVGIKPWPKLGFQKLIYLI